MFAGARRLIVSKGKKRVEIDPAQSDAAAATEKTTLGPSGMLRAPVARVGTTYLVGFHPDAWNEVFG